MKSIQTKFIVLILGCVLLSSLVIGFAGVYNAKRVVDHNSVKIMNVLCDAKVNELNGLLSRIEQSVKTLAVYALDELESVDRLKNDHAYVAEYTRRIESVAVNAAGNTDGAMAVYVRYNPEFTQPTSGLFWSKTILNGRFQQLTPTDFSRYNPEDLEHVGWYYIPVKSGKATWIDPYLNKNINVLMISYVIPLYKDNKTVGVVGMDIDFKVITDAVQNTRIYDTGYPFLTNRIGTVLYHPQFSLGTSLESINRSLLPLSNELKNGTNGSSLYSYEYEQKKKMAFRTLSNGMRFAVTAPVKEIDIEKNQLIWQIVIAGLIISCFSVCLTVFLTSRIIKPLQELNVAAQKIAEGDFSVSLVTQTKDEVGTLADSFQKTVSHLQKYIDYINGLAYRDALTGVKNKTAYQEVVQGIEEKMRLSRPQFAIVVLDINNLKKVNDNCGHDFGDMLILDACKLICKTFKHSPVYRIGGDEFVVILENADYEHYQELLENFATAICDQNQSYRTDSKISIARGIALYNHETDLVFGNVFKRADDAMYQNKLYMKEHGL